MTCVMKEDRNYYTVFDDMSIEKRLQVLVCLGLIYLFVLCGASKDLPPFVPKCVLDDPNLADCVLNATITMKPYLQNGLPEIKFPSLNPLRITEIELEQGTPSLNYRASLQNVSLYGLDDYVFEYFRVNISKLNDKFVTINCKVHFDKLYLVSQYNVTGRVLIAPIQGNGNVFVNVTNVNCEVTQNFIIERRNGGLGRRYLIMTGETEAHLDIEDSQPKYEGLFNGNSRLAELTQQVIIDNSKELIQEMTPEIETVVKRLVRSIGENIFQSIPFSKLLPKTKTIKQGVEEAEEKVRINASTIKQQHKIENEFKNRTNASSINHKDNRQKETKIKTQRNDGVHNNRGKSFQDEEPLKVPKS